MQFFKQYIVFSSIVVSDAPVARAAPWHHLKRHRTGHQYLIRSPESTNVCLHRICMLQNVTTNYVTENVTIMI